MQIIHPEDYTTMPWRNGGGVTHEIFADASPYTWRLSMAEVAQNGPFSPFPGLARILTVIDGAGIALETPSETLTALPRHPVAFSGEVAVHGTLLNGPIRDLNLIYNPLRWRAEVALQTGGAVAYGPDPVAIFVLSTQHFDKLAPHSTALLTDAPITLPADFSALVIRLTSAI
ncbi:MAG: HutD family protein [Paracoccaceae bacterium]